MKKSREDERMLKHFNYVCSLYIRKRIVKIYTWALWKLSRKHLSSMENVNTNLWTCWRIESQTTRLASIRVRTHQSQLSKRVLLAKCMFMISRAMSTCLRIESGISGEPSTLTFGASILAKLAVEFKTILKLH